MSFETQLVAFQVYANWYYTFDLLFASSIMLQYSVCSMRWLTEEDFERERERCG